MTIPEAHKRELYKYLYGILTRRNCSLLRMNGVSNHVHMLVDLHPSISLAELVQALKKAAVNGLRKIQIFRCSRGGEKNTLHFQLANRLHP